MAEAKKETVAFSDGEPPEDDQSWKLLRRVPSQIEASLLEGLLAEHEIASVIESVFFSQEPTSFGALGDFRVHVLETDWPAADRLVRESAEAKSGGFHLDLL